MGRRSIKRKRPPEEPVHFGFLRRSEDGKLQWRRAAPQQPRPRLSNYEAMCQREYQIKIKSLHYFNSKRFNRWGNAVPYGTDFAVLSPRGSFGGAEHRNVVYLNYRPRTCTQITCSCLRPRPDLGGCGGGCDGGGGGCGCDGCGGCGCDACGGCSCSGCGDACEGGCAMGGGTCGSCGGCGTAGACGGPGGGPCGGPEGASCQGGPNCAGTASAGVSGGCSPSACSCEGGCPGGACGGCSTGGGGCSGCSGGCGADCAGGGGGTGGAGGGWAPGGQDFGGGWAGPAAAAAGGIGLGGMDMGGGWGGFGGFGFGGMPSDIGFGATSFGPPSEQGQGGRGQSGGSLAGLGPGQSVDLGGFTGYTGYSATGQLGIVGTSLDFAPPGTYSAVSPAAIGNAMNYGSIVGPTETAVELGQSIATEAANAKSNAAINAPQSMVPEVMAALNDPGLNMGQIADIAHGFGLSITGPFGSFEGQENPQDQPAPASSPMIGPTFPPLPQPDQGGGQQFAGGFDTAAPSGVGFDTGPTNVGFDIGPSVGFDVAGPTGVGFDTAVFDQQDRADRGAQVAGLGAFAPDTMDMLTAGLGTQFGGQQFAALDTGTVTDVGGGFLPSGGGGGFVGGPSDEVGFGGAGYLSDQGILTTTDTPTDVLNEILQYQPSAEPEAAPDTDYLNTQYAADRADRAERDREARAGLTQTAAATQQQTPTSMTPEGFPTQASLAAQQAPGAAWSPGSLAYMGGTNDPNAARTEIAAQT